MYNQQINCRYYGSMIGCKYGNQCRLSHSNPNSVPLCRFFNNCSYGNQCRFRHINFHPNAQMNVMLNNCSLMYQQTAPGWTIPYTSNHHMQLAPAGQQLNLQKNNMYQLFQHHRPINSLKLQPLQQIPQNRTQPKEKSKLNHKQRIILLIYGYIRQNHSKSEYQLDNRFRAKFHRFIEIKR